MFSLQTLIVKLTSAFTALGIGAALDLTGYVPNTVQSLLTQNSIRVFMCVIPAVGMLCAYFVYRYKYKLNDEYMKKSYGCNRCSRRWRTDRIIILILIKPQTCISVCGFMARQKEFESPDLPLRRRTLYPAELLAHNKAL